MDWVDNRHDFVTAGATVVIALFTITLWFATRGLLEAAKTDAAISLKAANAAQQSAEALPALERGYVFIRPELGWSEQTQQRPANEVGPRLPNLHSAHVNCSFINHGRTPVVLWQYEVDFRLLSHPQEPDNTTEPRPIHLFPDGHIFEQGKRWRPDHKELLPFDQATMDAIDDGHIFVWFYGRMTYEDIMGRTQQTRFRWCYNGLAQSFMPRGGKPYNERT